MKNSLDFFHKNWGRWLCACHFPCWGLHASHSSGSSQSKAWDRDLGASHLFCLEVGMRHKESERRKEDTSPCVTLVPSMGAWCCWDLSEVCRVLPPACFLLCWSGFPQGYTSHLLGPAGCGSRMAPGREGAVIGAQQVLEVGCGPCQEALCATAAAEIRSGGIWGLAWAPRRWRQYP